MNKPTSIDPGRDGSDAAAPETRGRRSLLERAGDSFGLGALDKTPAVPVVLPADGARKFAPRRSVSAEAFAAPEKAAPAAPVAEPDRPLIRFAGTPQAIDRALLRDQGLIDPDGGASRLLEEFRIVKRQLLAAAAERAEPRARRVLVCSPHPAEGKTFCALNLALALAGERDSEVLLIDADFAKPSVLARLGLTAERGFMDVLADPAARVEDAIVGTDIAGLWVMGAGARTGRDSEHLASARTAELLDRLTAGARGRIVIFDSPPALAATPAAELAKHAGQALLVARADVTGRAALEDALDLLSACPDIRLLLNDASFSPSGRRFGSYYGYGE